MDAIDEQPDALSSKAEESLRAKDYDPASEHLIEMGGALEDLAGNTARLQHAFAGTLAWLENEFLSQPEPKDNGTADRARSRPSANNQSLRPASQKQLIQTLQGFSESIAEMRALLDSQQKCLVVVLSKFAQERESQGELLNEVNQRSKRIQEITGNIAREVAAVQTRSTEHKGDLNTLSEIVSRNIVPKVTDTAISLKSAGNAIGEVRSLLQKSHQETYRAVGGVADSAALILKELSALREEIADNKASLTQQGTLLETLSKKKGFLFG